MFNFLLSLVVLAQTTGFVTRINNQFYLNNLPFRFVGVNIYDAASNPATHNYDCGPVYSDTDLDNSFKFFQSKGITVVRFWAFQTYIKGAGYSDTWNNYYKNGPDWSGIDRVISYAHKYNLKILPVLENTSADCTEGGLHNTSTWFGTGYKSQYGNYPLSYIDWVKIIVSKYKNEPAIFSWMLMNEAGDEEPISSTWTPGAGVSVNVYNFTKDMSFIIKSIDSNHMVTLGTIDGNRGGIGGPAYAYIHELPTIDYIEAHDYGNDTSALPGSVNNDGATLPSNCSKTIACILWLSMNSVKKPMIIGEAGISISSTVSQTLRASEFDAKINAFYNDGGQGYMIWHWDPTTSSGMDFSPTDPLRDTLQKYAHIGDYNLDGKIDGIDYVKMITSDRKFNIWYYGSLYF